MHFNNVVDTKTSACFDDINILCYHVTLTLHFTIMPFVENWNKHVVHQHLNFKVNPIFAIKGIKKNFNPPLRGIGLIVENKI